MRRVIGVLVWGLLIISVSYAQNYQIFQQRGLATRTMRSNENELVAAHPNLPIGTRVKVTNLQNNREIVVTITGRILTSGSRIIDLSQVAAIALRMGEADSVSVSIATVRERNPENTDSSKPTG
jgi:rare lipoprotein A